MKFVILMAVGIVVTNGLPAYSQDEARYDKSIEKAAAKRAGEKIGALRGVIVDENSNLFVTSQDMAPKAKKKIRFQADVFELQRKKSALKPMVMGEMIDPVITGAPFKFDADGKPMRHHQEHPRATFMSIAQGLLDGIEFNPFPGD